MTSAWILIAEGEWKTHPKVGRLVIPVDASGGSGGTIWVMAHDEMCRFAPEDVRFTTTPAGFASMGLRVLGMMTKQLGGTPTLTCEGSPAYTVSIPYRTW